MQSYYTTIPTFITTREDLLDGEKIFYGVVHSLCNKYGFCWASNATLAKIAHKKSRQIQRYLQKLKSNGLLIVEIQHKNERKIWTKETWANRDELKKSFDQDYAFNQRFDRYVIDDRGGTSWTTYNKYNDINISKKKEDETSKKPPPSASVHLFSKNKNIEQKSASPPTKKEKGSLELSDQEMKLLHERMGSDLDKYIANRQSHLKKCPKSLHHKKRAYDTILEWYNADQKEKLLRDQAKCEKKTVNECKRAIKAKKLAEDLLVENPVLEGVVKIGRNDLEFTAKSGTHGERLTSLVVLYEDPEFFRHITRMCEKLRTYEKLEIKMPMTEDDYNRWEGL